MRIRAGSASSRRCSVRTASCNSFETHSRRAGSRNSLLTRLAQLRALAWLPCITHGLCDPFLLLSGADSTRTRVLPRLEALLAKTMGRRAGLVAQAVFCAVEMPRREMMKRSRAWPARREMPIMIKKKRSLPSFALKGTSSPAGSHLLATSNIRLLVVLVTGRLSFHILLFLAFVSQCDCRDR